MEVRLSVCLSVGPAQIGAALRPAFTADTPPHLTAIACQVRLCPRGWERMDLPCVLVLFISLLFCTYTLPLPLPLPLRCAASGWHVVYPVTWVTSVEFSSSW